jgi:hypothetical protein
MGKPLQKVKPLLPFPPAGIGMMQPSCCPLLFQLPQKTLPENAEQADQGLGGIIRVGPWQGRENPFLKDQRQIAVNSLPQVKAMAVILSRRQNELGSGQISRIDIHSPPPRFIPKPGFQRVRPKFHRRQLIGRDQRIETRHSSPKVLAHLRLIVIREMKRQGLTHEIQGPVLRIDRPDRGRILFFFLEDEAQHQFHRFGGAWRTHG